MNNPETQSLLGTKHRTKIDWCLTPTLAVFQLYRGVSKCYINLPEQRQTKQETQHRKLKR